MPVLYGSCELLSNLVSLTLETIGSVEAIDEIML